MDNALPTEISRDARHVVLHRLTQELARKPDFGLAPLVTETLDNRDGRLARAIYSECIRRMITVEYIVGRCLKQPWDNLEIKMRAALMVGTVQLLFFDHLPDHAVLNETVQWAGQQIRPKAKGMVNAILRKMIDVRGEFVDSEGNRPRQILGTGNILPLSDGRYRELQGVQLPQPGSTLRLAIQTSHPVWLIEHWAKAMSKSDLIHLAMHNLVQPPVVVNKAHPEEGMTIPHSNGTSHVWCGPSESLVNWLTENPDAWVQDATSQAAGLATAGLDLNKKLIVDFCAGNGTKTSQLAALHPEATIIATDVDKRRYAILENRFADHPRVRVMKPDELIDYAGQAALLVLDVPCSNSGVLARRLEARYRIDEAQLDSLQELQRQIIANSLYLRAPDGYILYSTCSLESMENEAQLEWVDHWHHLTPKIQNYVLPTGQPGEESSRYADGGYHALLR